MYYKMILPFIIHVFHCFIVLFIIFVPILTSIPIVLLLHTMGSFTLLVHWWSNNDACSLTLLECTLRGIPKDEAISQRFIGPLYNINDSTQTQLIYITTILLMCWSVYKLYNNKKCAVAYNGVIELLNEPELNKQDFKTRLNVYMQECIPLFK
jgi:hypothetical protein